MGERREEKNTSKDSRWHRVYLSKWNQVLIHYNGRILVSNIRLSLEGWKVLLSSKNILLCFILKCFELSVMIIVVPALCSRAPGAWFKEETLLAAAPKSVCLFLSKGII